MHRAVTHALACSDASEAPLLVALVLPAWEDSPWQANTIRQHPHMETRLILEKGHLKFVPHDRQHDTAVQQSLLTPADWPVELVINSLSPTGRAEIPSLMFTDCNVSWYPLLETYARSPIYTYPSLFPRAGQECRRSIPSTPWVETLRPLPIALPPHSPNITPPRHTQPHHPLMRSLHSDPVPSRPGLASDPSLVGLPPCPLPDSPVSLVEICGGIATGLEAHLRAGHAIRSYAWADINPDAYLATKHRLQLLRTRYPRQLPASAIQGWDRRLPFNANCLSPEGISSMFPTGIDLVVAGPPCQPFSYAGRHRGLEDPRSKALLNVARLIHYPHHSQPRGVSYVIENVPGTDKHPEVQRMLGVPVWLDAPPCGSGAHRETLFWQNLATVQHVQEAFSALPTPTLSINDRLSEAGIYGLLALPTQVLSSPPTYTVRRRQMPPPTSSHCAPEVCVLQGLPRVQSQAWPTGTGHALPQ